MNSSNRTWRAVAAAALLASSAGACTSGGIANRILTPAHVDFGELFVPEDTTRLDNSVLIGRIWMLDVNANGELLVLDTQSQGVYLFSTGGELVRAMTVTDCHPEAAVNFTSQATFLDESHIAVLNNRGVIVFDRNGACVRASIDGDFATSSGGICSHRDTVFTMPFAVRDSSFIRAYGADFMLLDRFVLPAPQFPIRAGVTPTYAGFAMACFDDDVWWVYSESFDASPRLQHSDATRFKPDFFVDRTQDYPEFGMVTQSNMQSVTERLNRAEAEATHVLGMFALDGETRMVVYGNIDSGNEELGTGAVLASHTGRFAGVSTLLSGFPAATADGMLYMATDPEDRPGGEAVNPAIIRYRFVPPPAR